MNSTKNNNADNHTQVKQKHYRCPKFIVLLLFECNYLSAERNITAQNIINS